jgi:gliding motility-associated-like protein
VCYQVGYYEFDISLPGTSAGYIIAYQRCCRIDGINNLSGSRFVGTTYTADIPGTQSLTTAPANNSARFIGPDTVIVCANNPLTYSFAANDLDGDHLTYSFCDAYTGGSETSPAPNPPAAPPYSSVPYSFPFNGSSPLGPTVNLNTTTGLITGIAPSAGIYVVTVCVSEIRNGVTIAVQRKDLQIKVGDCDLAKASLNPQYITCDGFTLSFKNLSNSPFIKTYFWDFGVTTALNDTSNFATPTFTYADTGVYIMKLVTNRNQPCSDSTTAVVKVFPGFIPDFSFSGSCITNPFQFTDRTSTIYGIVNSWKWDFGEPTTIADTSRIKNPSWRYTSTGNKDVSLIVTNSKGCIDTAVVTIAVLDKPIITLPFRDTLICRNDVLNLVAIGTGSFNWTPTVNIINANTATPTVSPTITTKYYVSLADGGCVNNDSVNVRVVNAVTLNAINDTTICQGDAIQLGANSNGLSYSWTPVANLSNPNIINPIAITNTTTTYNVISRIGGCSASDQVIVTTVPYPISNAGIDASICYNTSGQLNGNITGSSFNWSPATYLNNSLILNPIATPPRTTAFVLTVFDTLGCPKPKRDTVIVVVLPKVKAFAGNDTSVVVGEPLLFNATGGANYRWSPSTGLSNPTISNPVGIYGPEIESIKYKLVVADLAGCLDSAFVTVKIFKTLPSIFVPTAFTPNNDGLNDIVSPIAVGMKRINYFSIYNRWGQLVFKTSINGQGWDGKINGALQSNAVYVWVVSAVDYTNKSYFLKGTVALIR